MAFCAHTCYGRCQARFILFIANKFFFVVNQWHKLTVHFRLQSNGGIGKISIYSSSTIYINKNSKNVLCNHDCTRCIWIVTSSYHDYWQLRHGSVVVMVQENLPFIQELWVTMANVSKQLVILETQSIFRYSQFLKTDRHKR